MTAGGSTYLNYSTTSSYTFDEIRILGGSRFGVAKPITTTTLTGDGTGSIYVLPGQTLTIKQEVLSLPASLFINATGIFPPSPPSPIPLPPSSLMSILVPQVFPTMAVPDLLSLYVGGPTGTIIKGSLTASYGSTVLVTAPLIINNELFIEGNVTVVCKHT